MVKQLLAQHDIYMGDMLVEEDQSCRTPKPDEYKHVGPKPWDFDIYVKIVGIPFQNYKKGEMVDIYRNTPFEA